MKGVGAYGKNPNLKTIVTAFATRGGIGNAIIATAMDRLGAGSPIYKNGQSVRQSWSFVDC